MIYDYKKFRGIQHGYRSGLEDKIAQQLKKANISVEYETLSIKYTVPAVLRTYTPDFFLPNGIVIESKGRFTAEDRKKHLLHPHVETVPFIKLLLCTTFSFPQILHKHFQNAPYFSWV